MTTDIEQYDEVDRFCPECMTCFGGDLEACPECNATRPDVGWEPFRAASHPYLGKLVDGRYLLDRYLGGGTSGSVYRAIDVKLERPFALKILEIEAADESSAESTLRRFENEVEALSRIRNPHVINIYESYRLEDRTPAMLTEYIEGVTLEEILSGGERLDIDSAITVFYQIANGLHEAHDRGVVHRDLKPANIMIEELPAAGSFARILDFGLVHLVDAAEETRGFWGTPLYAAPEQCAPGPPISPASDIYSLGCLLFHCVAGRPPFVGDEPRAIMRAHVDEDPPRLSEASDRSVPSKLDEVADEMLQKSPEDRPDDLSEVIAAVQDLVTASGSWDQSVVTDAGDETSAIEESTEAVPADAETTDGTRIGVVETHAAAPRLAQLLQSLDLSERTGAFSGEVSVCCLDKTGDCAVLADSDRRIIVMSTGGASFFEVFDTGTDEICAIAPNPERGYVYAASAEGEILRWRLQGGSAGPELVTEIDERIRCMALGPGAQHIFLGVERGALLRHDLRLETTTEISSFSEAVTGVHVAGDGNWMLLSTESGGVYAQQTHGGSSNSVQLDTVDGEVLSLELDPASGVAAAVDSESRLRIFHLRQSFGGITIDPEVEGIRAVTIAPGRQLLVLSVDEPDIRVWRIRQENLEDRVPGFEEVGESIQRAFDNSGR